ncbi:MAG: DUF4190 domain-containing protein [Planctomycetia bacterium]|nr:DUF4190 domain-containing protein [Planctomycetia bacterium]
MGGPVQPHRGTMVLVLGILSIAIGGCGWILGPIAWSMGNKDLKEMAAGRMDRSGEGATNAGRICGIIGTILGCLALCVIIAYIILFVTLIANQ